MSEAAVGSLASVIIPAHDEQAVIERCLDALLDGPADLDVVVVANACSDATAERARSRGVTVVETADGGKANALNLGDLHAKCSVRCYLDADVVLRQDDLVRVVSSLGSMGILAAAPRLRWDSTGVPALVRAYYRVWSALPYVAEDLVGSGVYVLSAEGRRRFDTFPELIGDDRFIRNLFTAGERRGVDGATFTIFPPRNLPSLIAIKTRSRLGNLQQPGGTSGGSQAVRDLLKRRPWLAADAVVYLGVNLLAEWRARQRLRRHDVEGWDRDLSSRRQSS